MRRESQGTTTPRTRTRRAHVLLLAFATAVACALAACQLLREPDAPSRTPHVVLVTLDTLHVRWTGPYNPDVDFTPFLDRFAGEGLRFEHAYTPVPITLPSHAAMMTGSSPRSLGVLGNGDEIPDTAVTIAERFREAGYRTGAFISLGVLRPAYGLEQGFDDFYDPFDDGPARWYRRASEILPAASSWIAEHRDEPFFAWIHFSDPHEPYLRADAPPDTRLLLDGELVGEFQLASMEQYRLMLAVPPGRHVLRWCSLREPHADDRPETGIVLDLVSRDALAGLADPDALPPTSGAPLSPGWEVELENEEDRAVSVELVFSGWLERPAPSDVLPQYEAEVQYLDRHLDELDTLLATLGIRDETLVALVSDHGEGLFFHDLLGHAAYVFEDQLRVLWMMRGPGVPEGRVIEGNAAALVTDVAPTLLELLGLPTRGTEGRSWADCLRGGRCPRRESWWAFGLDHDRRRITGMAGYRWPYKWMWRRSFPRAGYQLEEDPWERLDLLADPGPDNPEPLKSLAEEFRGERRALTDILRRPRSASENEEREKLLRSLGYLRGRSP